MYDELVAYHYAAYRPPIHQAILEKALDSSRIRHIVLDIGCGTGRSSEALRPYCSHVVGIDPSIEMLSQAEPHERVSYINAFAEQLPIESHSIDAVSVAGSLNYINREKLASELSRICKPDAEILIYDFEVILSDFKEYLAIKENKKISSYDHTANLSGIPGLTEIQAFSDTVNLELRPAEICHLLLSEHGIFKSLQAKYQSDNPTDSLLTDIEAMNSNSPVNADIYFYQYALDP